MGYFKEGREEDDEEVREVKLSKNKNIFKKHQSISHTATIKLFSLCAYFLLIKLLFIVIMFHVTF